MKKIFFGFFIGLTLLSTSGCKKWLDINRNPNGPEEVAANIYLAPMLQFVVVSEQWDGRYISKYVQNFAHTTEKFEWDAMGYDRAPSDNGGEIWKLTYNYLGQNLINMMSRAEAEQRWDMLGLGYILKAIGFQKATSEHGEIIIKQAFEFGRVTFDYDSQEFALQEVDRLLGLAIENLQRTDGLISSSYMSKGDAVYKGNKEKWLKFAYGLRAINQNLYTNKSTLYNPAKVIEYVDKSFVSSADDALFPFEGGLSSLSNFFGQLRSANIANFRQTEFIVGLLNGTAFPGAVDPRLNRMLQPSPSGVYKGLKPTYALTTISPATDRPNTVFGTVGTPTSSSPGRYLFDDKAKLPLMTYAQLQFVKAEAAFRMGSKTIARQAYLNGVEAHLNFVNAANGTATNNSAAVITPTEITAFLARPEIIPAENALTLSHIMCQKYIAQWGWAFLETWNDMRRYHYTDLDPMSGQKVYRNFELPETARLFPDNIGKPVYRIRPRYASEYVWNREALNKLGGLELDFHTVSPWIYKP
jgi:hypothetical protein